MTRVKLIEAGNARDDRWAQCWYAPESRRFLVPLLALPTLAGMLPRHWDIEIVDEKLRDVDPNAEADLVCLSFKSKDAKRAYRYADAFRARNVPVILGGVHATSLPEEAAAHADAVVVGEAEGIFPQVIEDFQLGKLQKLYRAPPSREIRLDSVPLPRFDLIDSERYCLHAVQTSRGCLVGCEFCPVQKMFGGISRHKSLDRVMAEVEAVRAIDRTKDIFFVDEMFCGGDLEFQKQLLAELRRRRISFVAITDFKVITPAYIRDLARSGCRKLSINMPGTCLPQELKAVKAIQKLGIDVWGFFMFGFSFHERTVFRRVSDFVKKSGMKNLTLTVMAPFASTPAGQRTEARGAYLSKDWNLYDQCHVTFEPERMTAAELEEGFERTWNELERHLYFGEHDFETDDRLARQVRRYTGMVTLLAQRCYERVLGKKDPPVDLEALLGVKRVEVSVTTHNTMATT